MAEKYKIVYIIRKGEKNTRYLVQNEKGCFYSFVFNNIYQINDIIEDNNIKIENVQNQWIEQYKNQYPREQMMEHLIQYKKNILNNSEKGVYRGRHYDHIFTNPEQNLLLGFGFDEILKNQIKIKEIRSDFTHLTSSQAFAINFITPLITEKKLNYLDKCFANIDYDKCEFEKVLCEEKTQFDFFAQGLTGHSSCSIEVKYSENKFGEEDTDQAHIEKYNNTYKKYLNELTDKNIDEKYFLEYYQIWRNIIYTIMNKGQHICFFIPAFRMDLKRQIEYIVNLCKDNIKPFVHIIIADDIADFIISNDKKLRPYYEELKNKYLNFSVK